MRCQGFSEVVGLQDEGRCVALHFEHLIMAYGCRNVAKFDKNIFAFDKNYFHLIKIYLHSIKIFLCDKNIFSFDKIFLFDKIYISIR